MSLPIHVPVPGGDGQEEGYQLLKIFLLCFAFCDQPPASPLGQIIQLLLIALEARALFMRPPT
jgi:hypothetical protein